jgi:hypothetical protein
MPREGVGGQISHCIEAGEIGQRGLGLCPGQAFDDQTPCGLDASGVATGDDHAHPGAREAERGIEADPGARAGDEGDLVGQAYPTDSAIAN